MIKNFFFDLSENTGLPYTISIKSKNLDFALFQCTSSYPNKLENVGINIMQEYEKLFGCPVGLSDHSGKLSPSLYSIFNSYDILEVQNLTHDNSPETVFDF